MDIFSTVIGIFLFSTVSYYSLSETNTSLKIAAIISTILVSLATAYNAYNSQLTTNLVFLIYPLFHPIFTLISAIIIIWLGKKIESKPSLWTIFSLFAFINLIHLTDFIPFISPILRDIITFMSIIWLVYGVKLLFNVSYGRSIGMNILTMLISVPLNLLILFLIGWLTNLSGIPLYTEKWIFSRFY